MIFNPNLIIINLIVEYLKWTRLALKITSEINYITYPDI